MFDRDDLLLKSEQDIVRIKYEIEISRLELEQKEEMVQELEY